MTQWAHDEHQPRSAPPIVGGMTCYLLAGRYAVDLMDVCACGELTHFVQRLIARNGSVQLRGRCARCDAVHPRALSQDDWHPSEFPLIEDRTISSVPCERCGERGGTEEHHWAPEHLFDDFDEWPTSFLCRPCHTYWHRIVTPNMSHRVAA